MGVSKSLTGSAEPPGAERKGDPECEVGPLVELGPEIRFLTEPPREHAIQHVGQESEAEEHQEEARGAVPRERQEDRHTRDAETRQAS